MKMNLIDQNYLDTEDKYIDLSKQTAEYIIILLLIY